MEIWINPACSKCRVALSELNEAGVDYTVRRYLDEVPSAEELRAVVARLGLEPWDIARDAEAKAVGNLPPKSAEHRDDWRGLLSAQPQGIQRPIITADDGTTVIGRDPESVQRALDAQG